MTKAEALGQWYLRLNGFLTIPNFILHPSRPGSARTDVDVAGIRFSHRKEFDSGDIDEPEFRRSTAYLVLAEVKTSRIAPNRAWSDPGAVEDILRAIGISAETDIPSIADSLRMKGIHEAQVLYSAILFIGDDIDAEVESKYCASPRRSWGQVLGFVYDRFRRYDRLKTQVDQWDEVGQTLMRLATDHVTRGDFVREARRAFFLRPGPV
jgi:hypothetical protein